jgi:hypothetical protein
MISIMVKSYLRSGQGQKYWKMVSPYEPVYYSTPGVLIWSQSVMISIMVKSDLSSGQGQKYLKMVSPYEPVYYSTPGVLIWSQSVMISIMVKSDLRSGQGQIFSTNVTLAWFRRIAPTMDGFINFFLNIQAFLFYCILLKITDYLCWRVYTSPITYPG